MKTSKSHLPSRQGVVLAIIVLSCLLPASGRADIIPPPRLLLQPVQTPGLRVLGYTAGPPLYDPSFHYGIRTAANVGYSWGDALGPVTYSLTVTSCPAGTAQIMLIAGTSAPANAYAPAYSEANVIRLAIQAQTNGTAIATLGLKVSAPSAVPAGLVSFTAAQMTGTWTLTLDGIGAFLGGPGGASTNVDLPETVLSAFNDPLHVYFGGTGNDLVLSRVQISGGWTGIDEDFAGTGLNLNLWQVCSFSGSSVVFVPRNAKYWLVWPASSVTGLQVSAALKPSSWQNLPLPTNHLDTRGYQQAPICPDTTSRFYRALMR